VAPGKVRKGGSSLCVGERAEMARAVTFPYRWTSLTSVDESQRPCSTVRRREEVRHMGNSGKWLGGGLTEMGSGSSAPT
jgi:hypothetical protein